METIKSKGLKFLSYKPIEANIYCLSACSIWHDIFVDKADPIFSRRRQKSIKSVPLTLQYLIANWLFWHYKQLKRLILNASENQKSEQSWKYEPLTLTAYPTP